MIVLFDSSILYDAFLDFLVSTLQGIDNYWSVVDVEGGSLWGSTISIYVQVDVFFMMCVTCLCVLCVIVITTVAIIVFAFVVGLVVVIGIQAFSRGVVGLNLVLSDKVFSLLILLAWACLIRIRRVPGDIYWATLDINPFLSDTLKF